MNIWHYLTGTQPGTLLLAVIILIVAVWVTWSYRKYRHILLIPTAFALLILYVLLLPFNVKSPINIFENATTVLQVMALNANYENLMEDTKQADALSADNGTATTQAGGQQADNLPAPASDTPTVNQYIIAFFCVLLPILALGTLLQFLRGVLSWWLWLIPGKTETWFFTSCSDKAYALARNAMETTEKRVRMVFCSIREEDYVKLREIHAIPFTRSISELMDYYFRRNPSTVFFMKEDDAENMRDALDFIKSENIRSKPNAKDITAWKPNKRILLYISTSRPEAELLLNSSDIANQAACKGLLCRRIVKTRAAVYRELYQIHETLEESISDEPRMLIGGKKRISVVLAGCGWLGSEILKAYLWMYSRVDCTVEIHVLDREDARKRFKQMCPGIPEISDGVFRVPYSDRQEKGETVYSTVEFITVQDIYTLNLETTFPAIKDADVVYVALGEDAPNLECAIYLRKVIRRLRLQALEADPEKKAALQKEISEALEQAMRQSDDIQRLIKEVQSGDASASKQLKDWKKKKRNALEDQYLSYPPIRAAMKNAAARSFDFADNNGRKYAIEPFADKAGYYAVDTLLNYDLEKWALAMEYCYGYSLRERFEDREDLLRECYNLKGETKDLTPKQTALMAEFNTVQRIKTAWLTQMRWKNEVFNPKSEDLSLLQPYLELDPPRDDDKEYHIDTHIKWRAFMQKKGLEEAAQGFYARDYKSRSNRAAAIYRMCNAERFWARIKPIVTAEAPAPFEEFKMWRSIHDEEHRRWCIYMLTEGYLDNKPNKEGGHFDEDALPRDDIAGLHRDIIPFDDLKGVTRMLDVF